MYILLYSSEVVIVEEDATHEYEYDLIVIGGMYIYVYTCMYIRICIYICM
jgi:hypothetical protein